MNNLSKTIWASVTGALLLFLSVPAGAQPTTGSQLMTPQERAEHRAKMQSLPPAEREAYRAQHHEKMKKRAAAQGKTVPNQPTPGGLHPGLGPPGAGGAWGPGRGWGGPGYYGRGWGGGPGYYGRGGGGPGYYGRGWGGPGYYGRGGGGLGYYGRGCPGYYGHR